MIRIPTMTRHDHAIRRSLLLRLWPHLQSNGWQPQPTAWRLHRHMCFAARLGATLGAFYLLAAIGAFCYTMRSPLLIMGYLTGLAVGFISYRFLRTHHH